MKLHEVGPLNFNTQAQLAHEVSAALSDKFGYKAIGTWLYNNGGDEAKGHIGTGTIRIRLPKKDKEDPEFLGKVIEPWLRDNLERLLKRGVSSVFFRETDTNEDGTKDVWFNFDMEI